MNNETIGNPYPSLNARQRTVLEAMIPENPVTTRALTARLRERGTPVPLTSVSPVLSTLANEGYVRAEARPGNKRGYNWTRNRERTVGRKGVAKAPSKRTGRAKGADPLASLQADINALQVMHVRMTSALRALADKCAKLEELRNQLKEVL